jgi:hypothetical protein
MTHSRHEGAAANSEAFWKIVATELELSVPASSRELVEERLPLLQIGRFESLDEPAVNRR